MKFSAASNRPQRVTSSQQADLDKPACSADAGDGPYVFVSTPGIFSQMEANVSQYTGEYELLPFLRQPNFTPTGAQGTKIEAAFWTEALLAAAEANATAQAMMTQVRTDNGFPNYTLIESKPLSVKKPFIDEHGQYTATIRWRGGVAVWNGYAICNTPSQTINVLAA